MRETKSTHAAPLTKMTGTRVIKRCNPAIATIALPRIRTPAETTVSVEKWARSFCMRRAPPIAPAPKHPNNSPYPIALSSTLLASVPPGDLFALNPIGADGEAELSFKEHFFGANALDAGYEPRWAPQNEERAGCILLSQPRHLSSFSDIRHPKEITAIAAR